MTFEEDFPGLTKNDKLITHIGGVSPLNTIWHSRRNVRTHCRDNQKITEAIDSLGDMWHHFMDADEVQKYLRQALGLNNTMFGMKIKTDNKLKGEEFKLQ